MSAQAELWKQRGQEQQSELWAGFLEQELVQRDYLLTPRQLADRQCLQSVHCHGHCYMLPTLCVRFGGRWGARLWDSSGSLAPETKITMMIVETKGRCK